MPCKVCKGQGLEERGTRLDVKVPQGIEDGTQMILRGQGEDGPHGGPPGDLYVNVRVKPHPFLIRRGRDIIYEAEINFPEPRWNSIPLHPEDLACLGSRGNLEGLLAEEGGDVQGCP